MSLTAAKIITAIQAFLFFIVFFILGMDTVSALVSHPPLPEQVPPPLFNLFTANKTVYLVVVEKDYQRVVVYGHNGTQKIVAQFPCATGETAGKKQNNGDTRTPEGIYFITKYFADNKVTIFGKRAFHLDYPNIFDEQSGRDGNGIYIHGTNKNLIPNSTNGCITLKNDDLEKLSQYLQIDITPIVIVSNIKSLTQTLVERKQELTREIITPLILPDDSKKKMEFDSLYVIGDGMQTVAVGGFINGEGDDTPALGYSRVYLANSDGKWRSMKKIFFEVGSPQPKEDEPPVKVDAPTPKTPRDERQILDFIARWRKAWAGKQIDNYIRCYHNTFSSQGMNLKAWKRHKEGLAKRYKFISVDTVGIKIKWTNDGADVSFEQRYRSDQYQKKGQKTLHLVSSSQGYLIKNEWFSGK